MKLERKALIVFVNIEPDSEDSTVRVVEEILINTIPHLNPTVMMAPPHMQMPTGPQVTSAGTDREAGLIAAYSETENMYNEYKAKKA